MHTILTNIIEEKYREAEILKKSGFPKDLSPFKKKPKNTLKKFLRQPELTLIGEIKRSSPSKGMLSPIPDPLKLLKEYLEGGISALSVLTDQKFFSGSLKDLELLSKALENNDIPVLRKDFIVDPIQITESFYHGADIVLLIVAVLQERTQDFLQEAKSLGLEVIVEVHNEEELDKALRMGADIIGINNRNLHTFEENIETSLDLIKKIPSGIFTIAESAIKTSEHITKIKQAGFHGVLVGEALVTSQNPVETLKELRGI